MWMIASQEDVRKKMAEELQQEQKRSLNPCSTLTLVFLKDFVV